MCKKDFKILDGSYTYLDTAASAQKPSVVVDRIVRFYETEYANVHRGSCHLAQLATQSYEKVRGTVADFIGASSDEIVFTKGATEAINLVASSYAETLQPSDEVLVCIAEHHANFVPWQQACLKSGAVFKTFDVTDAGEWDLDDFKSKLNERTKVVAVSALSNVLGVANPVKHICDLAHSVGAVVLVDAAQSIAHQTTDLRDIGCEFLVFSGHKIYGPTGVGVLYGKKTFLQALKPYQFGGDMVDKVTIENTTFADVPARLEAGTPPIANAVGLGAAIDYLNQVGLDKILKKEEMVFHLLINGLKEIDGVQFLGDASLKKGLVAFNIEGIHADDLNLILAKENVCVRVGHHCAMPLHHRFAVNSSVRVSLGMYNDENDIATFLRALHKAIGFFK